VSGTNRPRVLFVSRERFRLPLDGAQKRKWDAVANVVEPRVLAAAPAGWPTRDAKFHLVPPARPRVLDGMLSYALLPARLGRELKEFRPDVALVQGVHETSALLLARRLTQSPVKIVIDIQGDWREATRLYGSPLRRLLSPLGDALGPIAVSRADAVRTISAETTALVRRYGREPVATFAPYVDVDAFNARAPQPLPDLPTAIYVGGLERIKGFDTLAEAWRAVVSPLPDARLRLIGDGRLAGLAAELVERFSGRVEWQRLLPADEVARAIDASWLLVLPSRSEGLGRVLLEAAGRGRALVGTNRGGIPDVIRPEVNGLLVEPDDSPALARALVHILSDRREAERLGEAARQTGDEWRTTPTEYAQHVEALVRSVLAGLT
jgi:glycosyltransferase involved in cell wall biosynthesis